jgi:hypothetical protein
MLHFCHGNVNRKPLVHYRNGPGINVKRFVKVVLIDTIGESVIRPKPARDDKEFKELLKRHLVLATRNFNERTCLTRGARPRLLILLVLLVLLVLLLLGRAPQPEYILIQHLAAKNTLKPGDWF